MLTKTEWTKFERGTLPSLDTPESRARLAADALALNVPFDTLLATAKYDRSRMLSVWMNNRYQVNIYKFERPKDWPPMVHLSIKRLDKEPIHDWRHLQRIKNELVGANCEALELYPAEDRVVDTANQYHLGYSLTPKLAYLLAGLRE